MTARQNVAELCTLDFQLQSKPVHHIRELGADKKHTVTAWNELPSDTISAQNLDMFKQNIVNIHHVFPY